VFVLISFIPGNPAIAIANGNPYLVPYIEKSLNHNQPLVVRYLFWLSVVVQGNFGRSYQISHQTVTSLIATAAPVTFSITLLAIILAFFVALVLGITAAIACAHKRFRFIDRLLTTIFSIAIAMPSFWLGYVLVLWFAVNFKWLPALGYARLSEGWWPWLSHVILPASVLGTQPAAVMALQLRGALLDVFNRDYILSARAKGLPGFRIVGKHALKNAMIPVVTVLGSLLAQLLGGAVIVETVFALPGLGTLAVQSALSRDVPVLLGLVVITTLVVTGVNLLVDISYGYLHPNSRSQ
jgi:peptide/nickel transport system permease protein